ncbi:MAG: hypothetical protein DCF25_18730 [Leptolyngbya foveolarum]|uniref:Response regulatory domain-containing protein n=1 Tax=Leptolyngbya foveolarum TaxID=47253 RepID=A0A2W4VI29_9CYAN|nr:MAG: hypothetical protein DCF25_18730 [Leptolyngbya foveolarum]
MRDRPLQLMLVDEDPRFRLGLKVWLEQQGDFAVVAEAGKAEAALKGIRSRFQAYEQDQAAAAIAKQKSQNSRLGWKKDWKKNKRNRPSEALPALPPLDLVLLDLGMGATGLDNRPGLQLCQQIKAEFPMLPVLVLSAQSEPALEAAAERAGASGCGTRSMSVRLLAQLIVQAASKAYASPTAEQQAAPNTPPPMSAKPIDPTTAPQSSESLDAKISSTPQSEPLLSPEAQTPPSQITQSQTPPSQPPQSQPALQPPTTQSQSSAPVNPSARPSTGQTTNLVQPPSQSPPPQNPLPQSPPPAANGRRKNSSALSRLEDIPGPLTAMRISMRLSGFQQIDRNIMAIEASKRQTTSWLNRTILDGKKRELTAARWLVASIWRTPQFNDRNDRDRRNRTQSQPSSARSGAPSGIPSGQPSATSTDWIRMAQQGGYGNNYADMTAARYLDRESLISNAAAAIAATNARLQARPSEVQNVVFESVFAKLQRPLKNTTQSPLEIDILRADKKLELLYLVLRRLEELLGDLRASNVQAGQLNARASQVIKDLWDAVNTDFFGKYYTVRVSNVEEEVVTLLQQEKPLVEAQILNSIPMVSELFGHWLFQEPMEIDGTNYAATTPRAIARSERLLENLVIQVANAIVQPLLNRLSDTEPIKKSLYTSRLMSSREIERFRNDLSWRYRKDRIVEEPQAIFESRYNLLFLGQNGIEKTSIYAPRRAELDRLRGLPLIVTLALETRDAIAPRLRTAFSLVGSSVVYVLTEVLGRGIGLVGRGVLKGVGNIRQEGKAKQRKRAERAEPNYDEFDAQNYGYREPGSQAVDRDAADRENVYVENPYDQGWNEWE